MLRVFRGRYPESKKPVWWKKYHRVEYSRASEVLVVVPEVDVLSGYALPV
jgi:hypothetical protein